MTNRIEQIPLSEGQKRRQFLMSGNKWPGGNWVTFKEFISLCSVYIMCQFKIQLARKNRKDAILIGSDLKAYHKVIIVLDLILFTALWMPDLARNGGVGLIRSSIIGISRVQSWTDSIRSVWIKSNVSKLNFLFKYQIQIETCDIHVMVWDFR